VWVVEVWGGVVCENAVFVCELPVGCVDVGCRHHRLVSSIDGAYCALGSAVLMRMVRCGVAVAQSEISEYLKEFFAVEVFGSIGS